MNIYFNLVNASKTESPIRVIITHRGKVYRKSVGLSADTKRWDGKRSGNARIDSQLRLIRIGLESLLDDSSTNRDIENALVHVYDGRWHDDALIKDGDVKRPTFWSYFDEWSERDNPAKRQRRNAYNLVGRIMGQDDDWNDIDSAYYFRLIRAMNDSGYSKNYQGSIVAKIKTVMSEGHRLKYHNNSEYRDFKKPSNEVDAVYLTQSEIDAIWSLELDDALEKKARDMLIIGCYTGARWEDYSQFSTANIQGKQLRYIQRKTGSRVTIPLSPRVSEVLKRNGGHAPQIGDVVFNRTVKTVCMRAGIDSPVNVRESKGDSYEHKTVPKWKMVSSHTCRRTMCTLLDKAGVPHKDIMTLSGHKSLAAFERYLKQTSQDVEQSLAKVKFFK